MPTDFKLPDLGEGIAEVELRRWLVAEGDAVAEHQPLVEVETDKAVVEVPAPRAGVVARLHRKEGETVLVGETLVTFAEAKEPARNEHAEEERKPTPRPASVGIVGSLPEPEEEPPPAAPAGFEGLATPMVRKMARERGIDLKGIRGTGPHGCIKPEDLDQAPQAAQKAKPASEAEERVPLRGLRRTIARNVLASQRTTAFVTSMEEVDITDIWEMRVREQGEVESRGAHLTFLPFFIKAVQHALREHPLLNGSIDDEAQELVLKKQYHFGIAVDTPEGLMVPVIRDVDKKSIIELAQAVQELGRKARERSISLEELRGSSFTITNYGHLGGTFATPIINWPDVAIMGFGRIVERPWVHRGQIAIRKILPLSLTFDHRATDGADAARFLGKVLRYLEDPALLFLHSA
ncbi:branched-chain alpha-keto acid dehydrogenase subunit E2 [Geoanaerobacter pelophilus]|uniref:Dihydrolipoamide acetyltransferase component of pyruvate dehydrogenase complex n=1 Tax=Geoanaerobacter pelophilus TaxID=60036 RepID=A0ABQ0ML75_9BACT|nr:dihydrolipoamide acetyltransferase family protein [Geoanaerobacter pelophilus]GAW67836.1 branched-chain alpha-keto acid dehydrogenase subunit E2 [Geoanaerobacter pelophilus]